MMLRCHILLDFGNEYDASAGERKAIWNLKSAHKYVCQCQMSNWHLFCPLTHEYNHYTENNL